MPNGKSELDWVMPAFLHAVIDFDLTIGVAALIEAKEFRALAWFDWLTTDTYFAFARVLPRSNSGPASGHSSKYILSRRERMFQMPTRHSKKKSVGKDVEIPLIRGKYRGFSLACYGCAELDLARRNVDRIWARKIYDAPSAAARAAVLAEERTLSQQIEKVPHRKRLAIEPARDKIDPAM